MSNVDLVEKLLYCCLVSVCFLLNYVPFLTILKYFAKMLHCNIIVSAVRPQPPRPCPLQYVHKMIVFN